MHAPGSFLARGDHAPLTRLSQPWHVEAFRGSDVFLLAAPSMVPPLTEPMLLVFNFCLVFYFLGYPRSPLDRFLDCYWK